MSELETRAARNVVIVATPISWPGQRGRFGQRERLSPDAQSPCPFQLDELVLEIRFSEVCRGIGYENTVKRRA